MKYVVLPEQSKRRLSFYLAMEEYVARNLDEPELFFMWQVEPSVIIGRHQQLESEVNVSFCREHGIQLYRRKSGGGCVYADSDNVMFSYITSGDDVAFTFNKFIGMVLLVLRKLGVEATGSSHNDVMIGDRKVSGTAFYQLTGRSIVHGTMLYDTNMDYMLEAITPDEAKLKSKGIQSVRQRVTLLKDHISLSLDEFKTFVRATLCDEELRLTPEQVAGIEELEQTYLREEFIKHIKS